MRKVLLPIVGIIGILSLSSQLNAQADRFAYSITDIKNDNSSNWNYLRKLNLQTGEYSAVLLQGNDPSIATYDAISKRQFSAPLKDAINGNIANAAFGTGVAAMAYDSRTNRLYYTPMFIDQLRYIDLKSMKVYVLTNPGITGMSQKNADQGNIITRMVIGADGNGYAMTNDAMHFIQFSTGKEMTIKDLGNLVDDQSNKGISVHNACSSFGGDMIADDDGNLYIFSARNQVFRVNIETRVATNLGTIAGLSPKFTVNGAAVNSNNQIVVASATDASGYYVVDPKTWVASPFKVQGTVWHSSDLANSNLLISGNKPTGAGTGPIAANLGDGRMQIYPNPITEYRFLAEFNQLQNGKYNLQVTDVMGRQVHQQVITITNESQTQNVNLHPGLTKGVYMVKVTNDDSKTIFSTKIIIQ